MRALIPLLNAAKEQRGAPLTMTKSSLSPHTSHYQQQNPSLILADVRLNTANGAVRIGPRRSVQTWSVRFLACH
jgi:hypothetical protein